MFRSHWFTSSENSRHYLMCFAERHPPELADLHLAQKIGELDPFVAAVESGREASLSSVLYLIGKAEYMLSLQKARV